MKLYTEEQVMKILFTAKQWSNLSNDYLIASVTPIELPSDEEIEKNADINTVNINEHIVFIIGAKWTIRHILNQNK